MGMAEKRKMILSPTNVSSQAHLLLKRSEPHSFGKHWVDLNKDERCGYLLSSLVPFDS